jgi:hypothetical protein
MTSPVQQSVVLLASAARTATPTVGPGNDINYLTNHQRFKGAHVILDVTAIAATPSVTIDIEGYDYGSGTWYNIGTGTAVTSVSTTVFKVHPDLTAAAGSVFKDGLPFLWRVTSTHADADSITYSLAVNYLD